VLGGRVPDRKLQPTNKYQGPSPSRESQYTCTVSTCIGCMPLRSKRSRHKSTYGAQSRNLRDDTLALVNCPHAMRDTTTNLPRSLLCDRWELADLRYRLSALLWLRPGSACTTNTTTSVNTERADLRYRLSALLWLRPGSACTTNTTTSVNTERADIDYRLCYGYALASPALRTRQLVNTNRTRQSADTETRRWSIPTVHAGRSTPT